MRKTPTLEGVGIIGWTPERQIESSAQSLARTVMIRVGMRDGVRDNRPPLYVTQ